MAGLRRPVRQEDPGVNAPERLVLDLPNRDRIAGQRGGPQVGESLSHLPDRHVPLRDFGVRELLRDQVLEGGTEGHVLAFPVESVKQR